LQLRVKGLIGSQQRELVSLHLGLLHAHRGIVFKHQADRIGKAEAQLAISDVIAQMLRAGKFIGVNPSGQKHPIRLALLGMHWKNGKK
jgi:hypothetical protein